MSFVRDDEKTASKALFDEKMRIGLHFKSPMRRNTKDLSSRETFIPLIDPPEMREKGGMRKKLDFWSEQDYHWSIG